MSKIKTNIVDVGKQTKSKVKPIKKSTHIHFSDHIDFKPNLSPHDVLRKGSFGGTYFRNIYSQVVGKKLENQHLEYPKAWFKDLDITNMITSIKYEPKINTYKVKCGQSLTDWEDSGWISNLDPFGWFQWYCRFYLGRRHSIEDERQIKRWRNITGEKGRHRNTLITLIYRERQKNKDISIHDITISPARRQTLQHWGYKLTKKDYDERIKIL